MGKLNEAQQAFVRDNPYAAVMTTLRPDGSPHSTVVWIDEEGGDLLVNTVVGRAKERHLRENPQVALTIVDPANAYKWVSVTGNAKLELEGADPHIDKLSNKYLGKDYPWRKDTEQRIIARVGVDKVDSYGFD
jgi:PPOX class probable F420-dependent enzyme